MAGQIWHKPILGLLQESIGEMKVAQTRVVAMEVARKIAALFGR